MIDRLAGLFENYLAAKTPAQKQPPATANRLVKREIIPAGVSEED